MLIDEIRQLSGEGIAMGGAVVVHQNQLMRRFQEAMATDPRAARTLADLGCRNSWIFRRMAARGVFVETKDGRYYMDKQAASCFVTYRRQKMLTFCAVALFVALVMFVVEWVFSAV
jgi:hypothetical protein